MRLRVKGAGWHGSLVSLFERREPGARDQGAGPRTASRKARALALASAAAFAISELCDFAVYTPLVRRGFALAVVLSCVAGAAIDSAAFLWLAFGSLQHVAGQVVGKTAEEKF